MPSGGYEFSPEQNVLIADLARKMSSVGFFLVAVGTLSLVAAVVNLVAEQPGSFLAFLLAGSFFLATGLWTVRGGRSFRAVVNTEGRDIELVMHALRELDRFYTLNFWLVIVYVATVLLALAGCPQGLG